jgi:hypothetical protein
VGNILSDELVEQLMLVQRTLDHIEGQLDDILARAPVDVNVKQT